MTSEAQRIAIAEAVGISNRWVLVKRGLYYRPKACGYTSDIKQAWIVTEEEANRRISNAGEPEPVTKEQAPLPDYLSDLNAMHNAIMTLGSQPLLPNGFFGQTTTGWERYETELYKLHKLPLYAQAHQQAEAFLRCIGKWDDSK